MQEHLLPFGKLAPPVFERLVLEYTWTGENAYGVRIYGKSGHSQYGLDIVGRSRADDAVFVIQCRRVINVTVASIRKAVTDYAGAARKPGNTRPQGKKLKGGRMFDATRLILAYGVTLEDKPKVIEEIEKIREEYKGDLRIDVYGAEDLSARLRDAPRIVTGIFGVQWAQAFCGEPPPPVAQDSASPFGLFEGPISILALENLDATARELQSDDPASAAAIDIELAAKVASSGYPGHSDAYRLRAGASLLRAGDLGNGFTLLYALAIADFNRGRRLSEALQTLERNSSFEETHAAKVRLLGLAFEWFGQGCQLDKVMPHMRILATRPDADAVELICLHLENALVDEVFAPGGPNPIVGHAEVPDSWGGLASELLVLAEQAVAVTASKLVKVRLRCAIADARLATSNVGVDVDPGKAYSALLEDASSGRLPPGGRSLAHSRAARAWAVSGKSDRAITEWRASVMVALPDGYGGDVRDAFQSLTRIAMAQPHAQIYDLGAITAAMPNDRRVVGGPQDRSLAVLDSLRRNNMVATTFVDTRFVLRQGRISGHIDNELWGLSVFADVMRAARRPAAAVRCNVAAGEGKKAAETAAQYEQWISVIEHLRYGAPWAKAAAARVIFALADLMPDEALEDTIGELLTLTGDAMRPTGFGDSAAIAALDSLTNLAYRTPPHLMDRLIELVTPWLSTYSPLTVPAFQIIRGLCRMNPQLRPSLAPALFGVYRHRPELVLNAISGFREPNDLFEAEARRLAADGDQNAIVMLASWDLMSEQVQRAARQAAAGVLRKTPGVPRNSFGFGSTQLHQTSVLVAGLARAQYVSIFQPEQLADPSAADGQTPDNALLLACGSPIDLAVNLARKLMDLAEDHFDAAANRAEAADQLAILIPYLPEETLLETAQRLLALSLNPRFGSHDDAEVYSEDPLQPVRINIGGRTLAASAIRTAACAFRRAVEVDPDTATHNMASDIVNCCERMLSSDDKEENMIAAEGLTFLCGIASVDLGRLSNHRHPEVRQLAIHGWGRLSNYTEDIPRMLAADRSRIVRRAVAARLKTFHERFPTAAAEIAQRLKHDPSFAVRLMASEASMKADSL